jgi:DNA-binding HxlR family transcriptional regulator
VPTNRSYHDACPIARGLDVVGERWALLVVRELLFGPRRFGDLRRALPAVSSNLLTDRLRELEAHGVLVRRGSPAVYELTDTGRDLEPVLVALGRWGARRALPDDPTLSAGAVLLYLRDSRRPGPRARYGVEHDGHPWTVTVDDERIQVHTGEPTEPVARLRTDPWTLNALLADPDQLDTRLADGSVVVDGDPAAVRRLLTP